MKLTDFWLPYAKTWAKVANLATLHVVRSTEDGVRVRNVISHSSKNGIREFQR